MSKPLPNSLNTQVCRCSVRWIMKGLITRGPPLPSRDHVLAYRIWEVLCKSHTAYMTRYNTRVGQEPKGRSPYASVEEARGALGTGFHWKNVRCREVGGVLSWQTRAGEWIPVESEPSKNCRRCTQKGAAAQHDNGISSVPFGVEHQPCWISR